MIISHQHRFVFVAVPKTGTHSVRQALREHLSAEDLEQVGLFADKRFPMEELAALRHGHLSLRQVRPHLGEDTFGSYFKFAFVRNPFDRFVSYCAFMTRNTDAFARAPRQVMQDFLRAPPVNHILFRPQHELLVDDDGSLLADDIGRVEQMQDSYDRLCARIGIPGRALDKVNATSPRGDYRRYYDDALVQGVAGLYRRDLELFGYGF